MPGTSTGLGGQLPSKAIRALAARLKSDARLKQIALLAGRFKRIAASKRRSRIKHGADEIADIEQGADLGRLLPSEMVKLAHPRLRLAFMRSFIERAALQYQLIGNEPLGKGPLVVALDKSGSMDGPRDIWATALALALFDQAKRERHTFALIAFDYKMKLETVVKPGEPLPEEALFTACAGGTEIDVALARGLGLVRDNQSQLMKADVVLITDGGTNTASAVKIRGDTSPCASTSSAWALGSSASGSHPGATTFRSCRTSTRSLTRAQTSCSPGSPRLGLLAHSQASPAGGRGGPCPCGSGDRCSCGLRSR